MRKLFSLFAALTLSVGLWAGDDPEIVSISVILGGGGKQSYFVGDRYDPSGLCIQVHWEPDDGDLDYVRYSEHPTDFSFSPDLNTELQTSHTKVTITYKGVNCDLPILVSNPTPVSTTYLDENGEEQNIDAFEVKDASAAVTWGTAGETTWYVVKGTNVQLANGATCAGDVRLILADNAKLTATGWHDDYLNEGYSSIRVSGDGNSLTIYGQSTGDQMGQLIATGGKSAAGIGGHKSETGSNITINGGEVTATGGIGAAGIGGGDGGAGSDIIINGGEVEATSGGYGAGIGGGAGGIGSNITINGGIIEANGGEYAAGIGGGMMGEGSNITINGGEVTATGGEYDGVGIGGKPKVGGSNDNNIYISDAYVLKAGAAANPTTVIAHSSAQDMTSTLTQQYVKIEGLATPYTRTTSVNQWATVCLPYAATSFSGAKFYRVNYYDGVDKLYIEEVSSLVAGQPYIFQATATTVTIEHAGVATLTYGDEQKDRGLHGSFARKTIAYDADHAFAALANNTVNVIEAGHTVTVPACRAYFDMNEVPDSEQPHTAPLRCISVPRGTPTDISTLPYEGKAGKGSFKVLNDGQLVIIKDNKMYNAQGQMIQ